FRSFQVAVFAFALCGTGIASHVLGVFLHVMRRFVRDRTAHFDGLVYVRGEVDSVVFVDLPGAAIGTRKEIFIATTGFREAAGDAPYLPLGIVAGIILRKRPNRSQT